MTIEECYTAMGANYQDVLRRFYKPDMIRPLWKASWRWPANTTTGRMP